MIYYVGCRRVKLEWCEITEPLCARATRPNVVQPRSLTARWPGAGAEALRGRGNPALGRRQGPLLDGGRAKGAPDALPLNYLREAGSGRSLATTTAEL